MRTYWTIAAGTALAAAVGARISLIETFDPSQGGSMNSIGFDRGTDEAFVHAQQHDYSR